MGLKKLSVICTLSMAESRDNCSQTPSACMSLLDIVVDLKVLIPLFPSCLDSLYFFYFLNFYLFLAALNLHCFCSGFLSSCGEQGLLLLIAVASLVADQALGMGFSSWSTQTQ